MAKNKVTKLGHQIRNLRPVVNEPTEFQPPEERAKGTPAVRLYQDGIPVVEVVFVEDVEGYGGNFDTVVTKVRLPESADALAIRGRGGRYVLEDVIESTYVAKNGHLVSNWTARGVHPADEEIDLND